MKIVSLVVGLALGGAIAIGFIGYRLGKNLENMA